MLCPRPTPLNRRPNVPNLLDPHRAHPPEQRVRSSTKIGPRQFHNCSSANDKRKGISGASAVAVNTPLGRLVFSDLPVLGVPIALQIGNKRGAAR
jgi:hypothetical protein